MSSDPPASLPSVQLASRVGLPARTWSFDGTSITATDRTGAKSWPLDAMTSVEVGFEMRLACQVVWHGVAAHLRRTPCPAEERIWQWQAVLTIDGVDHHWTEAMDLSRTADRDRLLVAIITARAAPGGLHCSGPRRRTNLGRLVIWGGGLVFGLTVLIVVKALVGSAWADPEELAPTIAMVAGGAWALVLQSVGPFKDGGDISPDECLRLLRDGP